MSSLSAGVQITLQDDACCRRIETSLLVAFFSAGSRSDEDLHGVSRSAMFVDCFYRYAGECKFELFDELVDDRSHAVGTPMPAQGISDDNLFDAVQIPDFTDGLDEPFHVEGADRLGEHAEGIAFCQADALGAEIDADCSPVVLRGHGLSDVTGTQTQTFFIDKVRLCRQEATSSPGPFSASGAKDGAGRQDEVFDAARFASGGMDGYGVMPPPVWLSLPG